ncbi:DMT family transporter [Pedobacter miscanthi]|uniref:Guanidinium exporter n=1 Tax=Pedobacter miscanthi TaxID=2259170 RepID=A0A366LCK9_9SPHI|nr:SMR family transporter [Pedobacter miscanthi]RBQ11586.1 QacE family quaternary ammonium compound efflux SMR transporter [Pedobacter miscanthi]
MNWNWIFLITAGLFEVLFAFCLGKLRVSEGMAFYCWLGGFMLSLVISLLLLSRAVQQLPIGSSYAVWTGIGTAGAVLAGIIVFKEPVSFGRVFFLLTLIISIIGLNLCSE